MWLATMIVVVVVVMVMVKPFVCAYDSRVTNQSDIDLRYICSDYSFMWLAIMIAASVIELPNIFDKVNEDSYHPI